MVYIGMLLGLLLAIPLALLIGAIILRAAVAWYNRMAGAGPQSVQQPAYTGYSANVAGGAESDNPFASPTAYGGSTVQTTGVPEPSLGRGMGIVFVSWLANWLVSSAARPITATAPEAALALSLLSIPVSFLIGAAILKGMLPTPRFGTACLIALLQFVIVLIIGLVIAGIVVVVWLASAAR